MTPIFIEHYTVTSACGIGREPLLQALQDERSGLRENDFTSTSLPTQIGRVAQADEVVLPENLAHWHCRNNDLAWLALQADDFANVARQAVAKHGSARVGLALGTSTSSIGETELAYKSRDDAGNLPADHAQRPRVHTPHSLGMFVSEALGIGGPSVTVSTACSSSAKVFGVAQRWLELDLVDAVVVGGVDSLCESVLHGFSSLQLVSANACRPFDSARDGINLGEAGGFALLGRNPAPGSSQLQLLGYGESSDAHHMSSPHPDGVCAQAAVAQTLERASLTPDDIDYLNLHGTASDMNDRIEADLVARCYGEQVHASATKGWTAHTLGAAGIVEAAICLLALEHGFLPGSLNTEELDPACSSQIRLQAQQKPIRYAASHSFGFGGSNCALLFGTPSAA
jgi:3-oxoacyl-[acyl-carrier-protein] synthase-1